MNDGLTKAQRHYAKHKDELNLAKRETYADTGREKRAQYVRNNRERINTYKRTYKRTLREENNVPACGKCNKTKHTKYAPDALILNPFIK